MTPKQADREARKYEGNLGRTVLATSRSLKALISYEKLVKALSSRDVKVVMALFPKDKVRAAYLPLGKVLKDAIEKSRQRTFK